MEVCSQTVLCNRTYSRLNHGDDVPVELASPAADLDSGFGRALQVGDGLSYVEQIC